MALTLRYIDQSKVDYSQSMCREIEFGTRKCIKFDKIRTIIAKWGKLEKNLNIFRGNEKTNIP